MGTAIPKGFKNLNLRGILGIYWIGQFSIVRSNNVTFDLRGAEGSNGQQADKKCYLQGTFDHFANPLSCSMSVPNLFLNFCLMFF
ncbi:MAG TPA: hypothetical protein DEF79_07260 [Gammaproteobacteria bacterium]|nr:hypothetical protein [Gammaproteobacteria bacterium]